ncbi:GTP-binding protein RHO1-like [Ctenocephalides felis]|uniref:GTP-binding protein RHO1-like n=1 Tax=Ctenocephalides felis TaxID=7515 RepID=UPI000E6E4F4A|nr:GTP-binding protein RHO1-like [Ctenocephalides felis]
MSRKENNKTKSCQEQQKNLKLVLVGDTRSGKTSLAKRHTSSTFTNCYVPTSFEKYSSSTELCGINMNFEIWDTSGSSAYDTVRPLAYQDANAFLFCFSVMEPHMLENIVNKWYPEVQVYAPGAPIILCGCQADIKNGDVLVSPEEAMVIGRKIGAVTYIETSAKLADRSVSDAFEVAALAATGRLSKKQTQKISNQITRSKTKNSYKTELKIKTKKNCTIM